MEQKIQGYLHPNIQKPSDEQYFKFKHLVEDELGLDWSKEKKYLLINFFSTSALILLPCLL